MELPISSVFKLAIAKTILKIDEVAYEFNLDSVYLFGSCARGEALPGSDVDLLLVTRNSTERSITSSEKFWDIDDDTANPPIQLTVRKLDILSSEESACCFNNVIKKDLILLRRYDTNGHKI